MKGFEMADEVPANELTVPGTQGDVETFQNVDPVYANYANDVDKPYVQEELELDYNLQTQFANGEVPKERQDAEKSKVGDEEEAKFDSDPETPAPKTTAPNVPVSNSAPAAPSK